MLHGVTIFLSALLLFGVQPLAGRQIVPWFGGTAAVWTACMLFFQIVLLAGYSYAHLVASRLAPRRQAQIHWALLALSLPMLPIIPSAAWKPLGGEEPTWRVLGALASGVGLPYFVLSTTNPLLSSWYSRLNRGAVPYHLFSLSNLGAMIALFAYPLAIEPNLTLRQQAWGWTGLYVLLVLLLAACARQAVAMPELSPIDEERGPRPTPGLQALWLGLSATSSVLLLAITNFLSQNVAAIPFLWVLPLALYLLSFILCFSPIAFYQRLLYIPAMLGLLFWISANIGEDGHNVPLAEMIPMFCSGLFVFCMVCHGELARSKPAPRYLTQFYLLTSLGGALGGLFVGLVSPHAFPMTLELPIGLWSCAALACVVLMRDSRSPILWSVPAALLLLALGYRLSNEQIAAYRSARLMVRNFYGPLVVEEVDTSDPENARRRLTHGTITHGSQFLDARKSRWNISYYSDESGVGHAVRDTRVAGVPQRVGVIGLGTGTLAALGRPEDHYTYYEIDPLVEELARTQFTYLKDCPAQNEVLLGDARLTLERQDPQNYDVLAVDAFSSDSIPIHLLTREAFGLYFKHLKQDGLLAVHISNRYLDLEPVLATARDFYGKDSVWVRNKADEDRAIQRSVWVLIGQKGDPLIRDLKDDGWPDLDPIPPNFRPWTDDYSNLFRILDADELPDWLLRWRGDERKR